MKVCGRCKKEKPFSHFYKNARRKDGYQSSCIECRKIEQKRFYENNKERLIKKSIDGKQNRRDKWLEFKKTLSCQECGEDYYNCLDFHHLNPEEKDFELGKKARSSSWNNLLEEISKCVVLCRNCHKKVHDGIIKLGD